VPSTSAPTRRFVSSPRAAGASCASSAGSGKGASTYRIAEADWAVIVSADVGASLLGLHSRYTLLGWSIAFALAAAVAILLLSARWLARPLLDIRQALHVPGRSPHDPLAVEAATRRLHEYDELVTAFNELGADFTAVERELVQAEKTSLLGQLASGLAHEMGTPLNVITGNAQYLLRKVPVEDPRRPALEQIISQAQRIAAMIRRLLDVSRPAEARLVPVDLGAVIRQTLEIVPSLSRDVELYHDLDPDLGPVLADPKLPARAMNLVVNAWKTMKGGRLRGDRRRDLGRRRRAGLRGGDGVRHRLRDPARAPFPDLRAFFTASPPRGTGLNLAIVRRIVHSRRPVEWTAPWGAARGTLRLRRLNGSGEPHRKRQEGR
jgi:signal transduction histidine kinase